MQGLTAVDQQHATTRDWPIIVTAGVGFFSICIGYGHYERGAADARADFSCRC